MKRILTPVLTLVLVAVLASPYATHAQDGAKETKVHLENKDHWNQFRGPNGDGKTPAKNLPVEFGETKNVRWKTPIHDEGWSSPVVWGNQIWLTTGREDGSELFAICVGLESGKIVHDIKVFDVADPQKAYGGLNTHATPTPVVEDGCVYVHFGTYGTACLDTKTGQKLWERRDLNCDHRVRPASSPIIDGHSLFLHFDGVDVQFVAALDKDTGKTLWLRNREVESDFAATLRAGGVTDVDEVMKEKPNDHRKAYATPTTIEYQGQRQLISPGAEVTFSYDPANGKELWRVRHPGWGWNAACRPVFEHGLVYVTTGQSRRLLAVRPSGTGDVTDTHVAWSNHRFVPNMPSPLIVGDLLFMVSDQGYASCLEAKTGRELWKERLRAGGDHWASPFYADGKIYFCGNKGVVSVICATREFQLLAENRFDASFIASPAIAADAIILRSLTHLYCVAEGYEMAPQPGLASTPKPAPAQIASSDLEALGTRLKEAVDNGEMTEVEAKQKYQEAASAYKSKPGSSKPISGLSLEVTGYYMGGKTRDDGEFEATFLIESPDLDKDDWPTVTFTGEPFRASFANLTQYHRVTLNLAEGSAKKRRDGK